MSTAAPTTTPQPPRRQEPASGLALRLKEVQAAIAARRHDEAVALSLIHI
jgi:hypothetical protein